MISFGANAIGQRQPLKVFLCSPRGFCAGVVRAIDTVERALARYGAPVYVRHEIVHNRYVVESLKRKGAIFVEELHEIPETDAPVIFSAHGVPKSIPAEAQKRRFFALDATCPLVTKVHREAEIHHKRGREIVLIGHAGHPEVIGTIGQLLCAARFRQARVSDADHALGRRYRRDRDGAQGAFSAYTWAA
jgi:4-hydroxy-3-methylbut-2-enyl diphosphate reductase